MRIVYLHTNIWGSQSPSSVFVTYYTHALAKAGMDVELILQANPKDTTNTKDILEDYFGLDCLTNWKINPVMTFDGRQKGRREYYRKVHGILKDRLAGRDIDVMITRSLSLLPILLKVRGKSDRSKVFFESHDFFSSLKFLDKSRTQGWKNFFRERIFLPRTDGLICLQKPQAELYRKVYKSLKIFHLPSGCRELIKKNRSSKEFTLVYIGSLDLHKGVGDLLDIWRGWKDAPKLMIVGGKKEKSIQDFNERIVRYGLSDKIELIPWRKPSELGEYLNLADAGLLPLRETFFNRYLTFPLKMMDYIGAGLPVISRELPTIKAVLQHNHDSLLLHEFNLDQLAAAVDKMRNDTIFYNSLAKNIKLKTIEYSWKARAEKSAEIFG